VRSYNPLARAARPTCKSHFRRQGGTLPLPEWQVIGAVRKLALNGRPLTMFEFRGEVTRTDSPVLIVADGWDVIAIAERYPTDWRACEAANFLLTVESGWVRAASE